ncbi:prepilin-type N-terminal cleavage/methylation domain-containing protein [Shewanella sp. 1CM18E]|uniref:prepilin-type N-terminal cleavage/methylation domain-containing protein n=1 Tax=Shewanella sp. 1CM18E TaxID=2929169 RepID=UPI0020BF4611|nr:prepilin-type N-terminal cleavage/methylation domain-containing protein [Shewanella sp. 1CM18E]MCK8045822.1 prepilin-type N-terminal cleavage/methylation domain-containing protein [Shewanella sp. 1CM18E]
MQKQNGFTLIELVVVIIILGILAVTAAPKFINLQTDARQSALQGVKGAIQGANGLVFAKAALAGEERNAGPVNVDIGTTGSVINVPTTYGYMTAEETTFELAVDASFVAEATNTNNGTEDWIVVEAGTPGSGATMVIYQRDAPNDSNTCQLTYKEATATSLPEYTIADTGC